jgi:hypothetical protein
MHGPGQIYIQPYRQEVKGARQGLHQQRARWCREFGISPQHLRIHQYDTSRAKNHLNTTSWEPRDTIDMFNSRFTKRLAAYHTTLSTTGDRYKTERISPDDQVKLYQTRLVVYPLWLTTTPCMWK